MEHYITFSKTAVSPLYKPLYNRLLCWLKTDGKGAINHVYRTPGGHTGEYYTSTIIIHHLMYEIHTIVILYNFSLSIFKHNYLQPKLHANGRYAHFSPC